jgi:hypothetical protein
MAVAFLILCHYMYKMGAECNASFNVKYNNVEKLIIITNNGVFDIKNFRIISYMYTNRVY